MFQTLVVGLGRSGEGLHLPVLSRVRAHPDARALFSAHPIVLHDRLHDRHDDRHGTRSYGAGTVFADSLERAARAADPAHTVVHVCTPPTGRADLLAELAGLGFRRFLVEKPLAVDEGDLERLVRLRERADLRVIVVSQWLASELTSRLGRIACGGELGALRSIAMTQNKPRFRRTLADTGHPTAFDVEMPHSLAVALRLAGSAHVAAATCGGMALQDIVLPRVGHAWLALEHQCGIRTEIRSDLTSPTRERRIELDFEHGSLIGHYACSEDDDTAQLRLINRGRRTRAVFRDDTLTTFILRSYQRFARDELGLDFDLHAQAVHLMRDAKRQCADPDDPRLADAAPPLHERMAPHV